VDAKRLHRPRLLIDGTRFMMDPANLNDAWRDANIIPRYDAAGVRRFAFLFHEGARHRRTSRRRGAREIPDRQLRAPPGGARLARWLTFHGDGGRSKPEKVPMAATLS
jgi:hypothetical protein